LQELKALRIIIN